jgi:hypothetical protein
MKALLALAAAALMQTNAADQLFYINIDPTQQAFHNDDPPGAPDRSGSGQLIIVFKELGDYTLQYQVIFGGLSGGSTEAHIHGPAAAGADAPVQLYFHSGAFGMTSGGGIGEKILSQDVMDGLSSGLWYVDVHSSTFPSGEIRGQIIGVPEPGTVALILAGAALTFALHRKRLSIR